MLEKLIRGVLSGVVWFATGFYCLFLADFSRGLSTETVLVLLAAIAAQAAVLAVRVPDLEVGMDLINAFAPEHLELCVADPEALFAKITHAGAVFLGQWTPEAIGDYVGGPNHVLPTARSARFSSGLSVLDFMKRTTVAQMTPDALRAIGPAAETLAISESLEAHGLSVRARLQRLNR